MQLSANPHMPKLEGGGGGWEDVGRSLNGVGVVRHHSNNDMGLKNIMFLF